MASHSKRSKKRHIPNAKAKIAHPKPLKKEPQVFDGISKTKMRIIGIGGGGGNIVSEISQRLQKTDFIAANTDAQALKNIGKNTKRFAFGQNVSKGLGCGMDPAMGLLAAQEDREKIKKLLEGQDLCVLIATLGGGTGSGAAPLFAELCQELKNLTVGIFIMPFSFEGEKRKQIALNALEKLKPLLNAYVVISNDRIFQIVEKNAPLRFALSSVNKKLAESLHGFIETLFLPGLINVDFADVKALLQGRGRLAYLSSMISSGEDRVKLALDQVLLDPLYEYQSRGAERILFNVAGSKDLKMDEVAKISRMIFEQNAKAKIIFGISLNEKFLHKLRITVFAIGCEMNGVVKIPPPKILKKQNSAILKKHISDPKKKKETKFLKKKPVAKKAVAAVPNMPKPSSEEDQNNPAQGKQRRNALDVKKAIDEEIQELQEKEKEWDAPAFLRFKRTL